MSYYILDDHRSPVAEPDLLAWGRWYKKADRQIFEYNVDGVRISTVFLGHDNRPLPVGPPILYETMIWGGEYDRHMSRCATEDEARFNHAAAIAMVKGLEADALEAVVKKFL